MDIPPGIQRLLGTSAVRRLGRLRQLADLSLSLPAASHTRLVHSLGVMHVAGAIFDRLLQRSIVQARFWADAKLPELEDQMRHALQVAALLHDLGHGPFSHLFETVVRRLASSALVSHEARTVALITDTAPGGPGIADELRRSKNRFATPDAVAEMIRGRSPIQGDPTFEFLGQVISGDLDADRMDYLRRDELQTGVSIGNVDPWPIIDAFTLARDPDGTVRLALPEWAEDFARQFLLARHRAYQTLYNSPESLATHELLVLAFDERYPDGLDAQTLQSLSLETDEGLLIRLEEAPATGSLSPVAKDVVRRLRDDAPYLVLPVKFGGEHVRLSERARRTLARWRRPVDRADALAYRRAIVRVATQCFPEATPWRVLLVLEEGKDGPARAPDAPWILEGPTKPARPFKWESPARAAERLVSMAVPPECLISYEKESALREAASWKDALSAALANVRSAKIGQMYSSWLREVDPDAPAIDEGEVERLTGAWLAQRIWSCS